jgi:hypothetical protein
MFNFFKKKKAKEYPITKIEVDFFRCLITILPDKYHYLLPQINDDFLISYEANILGFKNSYTFSLNAALEPRFANKHLPAFFILQNIKIWNKFKNDFTSINLNILSGYLGGFNIESIDFTIFDLNKFDTSEINEKHFDNQDFKFLLTQSNFDNTEKEILAQKIDHTYCITLSEGKFFYIDNVGNGDVIAIDATGNAYILTHDPYKITKIFTKKELFSKLENDTLVTSAIEIYNNLLLN